MKKIKLNNFIYKKDLDFSLKSPIIFNALYTFFFLKGKKLMTAKQSL